MINKSYEDNFWKKEAMVKSKQVLINRLGSLLLCILSLLLFIGAITNQYVSFVGGILLGIISLISSIIFYIYSFKLKKNKRREVFLNDIQYGCHFLLLTIVNKECYYFVRKVNSIMKGRM